MRLFSIATFLLVSCSALEPDTKTIKQQEEAPEICVPSGISDQKDVRISWTAIKNGNTPVEGTLDGTAVIVPAASLKGTKVTLTFNPLSINSGIELRDSRIASIFFESASVTYSGTIAAIDVDSMPKDGETRKVTITGTLLLAGNGTSVTAYAVLENKNGSISLSDDPGQKSSINVTATPGMKNNVNKLLSVASVSSMESAVAIKGTLPLITVCN